MGILVLSGGGGGARLAWGLAQLLEPERLTVVVNTGDDIALHGLHISPDLDVVTYTLASLVDPERGRGIAGDTYHCADMLVRYGQPAWVTLGDRELGTHLVRSQALRQGRRLTEVTDAIRRALGVRVALLPMADESVATHVLVGDGALQAFPYLEYLLQRQAADEVRGVEYRGSGRARLTPEIAGALEGAEAIVIGPSSPVASIGPILAVPGLLKRIRAVSTPCVAVSPIVGGRALAGPTEKFLRWAQVEISPLGVARYYRAILGRLDGILVDHADADLVPAIEALGTRVLIGHLVMQTPEEAQSMARRLLEILGGA